VIEPSQTDSALTCKAPPTHSFWETNVFTRWIASPPQFFDLWYAKNGLPLGTVCLDRDKAIIFLLVNLKALTKITGIKIAQVVIIQSRKTTELANIPTKPLFRIVFPCRTKPVKLGKGLALVGSPLWKQDKQRQLVFSIQVRMGHAPANTQWFLMTPQHLPK